MTLGEIAYRRYCDHRGWKSVNGDPLPQYTRQKPELQAAWESAAAAVIEYWMTPPPEACACRCSCADNNEPLIDPPTNTC